MKALVLAMALTLGLGVSAQAASSSKICFGIGTAKGKTYNMIVSSRTLVLSGDEWEGSHKVRSIVQGRNGVDYLEYALGNVDGDNAALVNSDLLKPGTKGLLKLRWRGESFAEEKFFCRDQQ